MKQLFDIVGLYEHILNRLLVKINLWQIVAGLLERRGERNVARRKPGLEAKDRRQHFVFEYNHEVFIVYRSVPDHALYVLADPAEPPDVAGDESEGDRVQALSCRRVRACHRGEVDLHSHLGETINSSIL